MTDEEWDALSWYLPSTGRPPRDRRRTWDAIFRFATSTLPWAALPPEYGRPDTAHSALILAARTGRLERMLIGASGHPLAPDGMVALAWRIACAIRRASRQLPAHVMQMAHRLGFDAALPFDPGLMPGWQDRRPDAPPSAFRDLRLPRIPRRALRGLAPPRGFAPKAVAQPNPRPPAPLRRPKRPGRPPIHGICPKPPRTRGRAPGGGA